MNDERRELRLCIGGGGPEPMSVMRSLRGVPGVVLVAVYDENEYSPSMRLAEESGLPVVTSIAELDALTPVDLVLDFTPGAQLCEAIGVRSSGGAVVIGGVAAGFIHDLLVAREHSEDLRSLLEESRVASERLAGELQRLRTGEDALRRANEELDRHLAESYFMHEYFRTLTTFRSIEDVTSLIVDGTNGILGTELSAIYLFDPEGWTFKLGARQGRPEDFFRPEVPITETILGVAFREGLVQQERVGPDSDLAAWSMSPGELRSQAAVPLRIGDTVTGVLVVASSTERRLSPDECGRLEDIAERSSLALQNAFLHDRLEHLSITDRLTELYNHAHLHQRLDEEVGRAARFGRRLSVIMLDIDNFKQFNDQYGHPKGDAVLRAVGSIIRDNLREIDLAARYGGEEFVVVLPETDLDGAAAVAERIRSSMEQSTWTVTGGGAPIRMTISLGVATYPAHASTAVGLIEAADQAMYQAKRAGKNQVVIFG